MFEVCGFCGFCCFLRLLPMMIARSSDWKRRARGRQGAISITLSLQRVIAVAVEISFSLLPLKLRLTSQKMRVLASSSFDCVIFLNMDPRLLLLLLYNTLVVKSSVQIKSLYGGWVIDELVHKRIVPVTLLKAMEPIKRVLVCLGARCSKQGECLF